MDKNGLSVLKKIVYSPELFIFLSGFLLNFVWEVSQIPFYAGYFNPFNSGEIKFWFGSEAEKITFVQVFWEASLSDAMMILIFYWVVSLIFWNRFWFIGGDYDTKSSKSRNSPIWGYLISMFLAVSVLAITEYLSQVQNWWGYSNIMPKITKNIGLIPLLGMLVTTPLSYVIVRRIFLGVKIKNTRETDRRDC